MKNKLNIVFLIPSLLLIISLLFNVQAKVPFPSGNSNEILNSNKDGEGLGLENGEEETSVPRRDDDYKVLGDDEETISNDDGATTQETMYFARTEFPIKGENEEAKLHSENGNISEDFAIFGLTHRTAFPVEELPVNITVDKSGNSTEVQKNETQHVNLFSESSLPNIPDVGGVDVHLAQLANVNVFSSNASKVDVFVSKNGLNCTCGIKIPDPQRIVDGMPVKINELPWTVALFKKNWIGFYGSKPYCGGSLINSRYVLTASHCVDGMQARSLKVRLNEEDLTKPNENEKGFFEIQVEEIMMHPKYNRRTIDNDVALLKLATPVDLGKPNGIVVPVCLPASNNNDLENYIGTVAGWGAVSQGGSLSQVLRKVDVPIISNHDCNTRTTYNGRITDNMLCAGYLDQGGKDSCQGDSGGPLIIDNAGRRTLVGVVSWGYGCAKPKSPGVYARVSRYAEWILSNTKEGQWCTD